MMPLVNWVVLRKYIEITGDSIDAVQARRKNGEWEDGKECKKIDGTLWISLTAANEWVAKWGNIPTQATNELRANSPAFSNYLPASELADLIGCKPNQRLRMASWLDKHCWPYVLGANGLPRVSRNFHNEKMNGVAVKQARKLTSEPNFDAFKK